ncbi:Glucose-induced degradation protein 4 [Sphaceloma murrayae]|uniref:Glucose-induced degradation protein 4 n=1 Tax=Sphaceloma murrayae TaxID=2082308 RepID=A0A2K1QUC5_9PEZI|nr:Glucose-induced degradation protein 4 [Sphaceloma murrayae]
MVNQVFGSTLLFAITCIALPQHHNHTRPFSWQHTNAVLAFGDSYTFVRGTYGRENYSFIADALRPEYTPVQLENSYIIQNQTGTSAGGPNWVEYLTKCGLETQKPSECTSPHQRQLWDFAFAGADVSAKHLPLHHNYTIDLDSQISSFATQAYPSPLIPKGTSTLVALWIGINDINDSAKNATVSSFPAFYQTIQNTMFESVQTLYDLGYRDYLFMNLPPLDRTPGNILNAAQNKTIYPSLAQIGAWNEGLADRAAAFAERNQGAKVMVFDTFAYLHGVLDRAAEYGLKNTTGYCARYDAPDIATNYAAYGCGPIREYFWYNTGHVTYRVHEILAEGVRDFLENAA